jgi:hypothetical protein
MVIEPLPSYKVQSPITLVKVIGDGEEKVNPLLISKGDTIISSDLKVLKTDIN